MTKSTKIIAALGVAAGLGIAALPAGAIFATGEQLIPLTYGGSYGATTNVQLTVNESIALATQKTDCRAYKNDTQRENIGTEQDPIYKPYLTISDTGSCSEVVAGATNAANGFIMKVEVSNGRTSYLGLNGTTQDDAAAKVVALDGTAVDTSHPGWNITGGALTNAAPGETGAGVTVMQTNSAKNAELDMTYNYATRADQQAGDYETQITYTIAKNASAVAEEVGTTNARVIVNN